MYFIRKTSFRLICCSLVLIAGVMASGFSSKWRQTNGEIEGYVLPKAANARVVIAIPNPANAEDTIRRTATPDANGYYKLTDIPSGFHRLIFLPGNKAYKSKPQRVAVEAGQTLNLGTVTLESR